MSSMGSPDDVGREGIERALDDVSRRRREVRSAIAQGHQAGERIKSILLELKAGQRRGGSLVGASRADTLAQLDARLQAAHALLNRFPAELAETLIKPLPERIGEVVVVAHEQVALTFLSLSQALDRLRTMDSQLVRRERELTAERDLLGRFDRYSAETTTHDGGQMEAFEAAAAARAQYRWLTSQMARLDEQVASARQAVDDASVALDSEIKDVEALESVSLQRVLASVRRNRLGELERERAEVIEAGYRLTQARDVLAGLLSEHHALQRRRDALGQVDVAYERAAQMATNHLAVHGAPEVAELDAITAALDAIPLRRVEITEAITAGRRAEQALVEALKDLSSAHAWSTYDTWLDGGIISSIIKHDNIGRANDQIGRARFLLGRFKTELADVAVDLPSGAVSMSSTLVTLDVWFDNFFSDFMVDRRIAQSRQGVQQTLASVREVLERLAAMERDLKTQVETLAVQRDQVLAAAFDISSATSSNTDSGAL